MPGLITRREFYRCLRTCSALFALFASTTTAVLADWRTDVGYDQLSALLGDALPNGAGVPISLVEAMAINSPQGSPIYFPDTTHAQFGDVVDPLSTAVNFIDGTGGQANGNSGHAFDQARTFFGNWSSVAPAANEVTVYETNDWLQDVLNLSRLNADAPEAQNFRVQNHSWIGTFATPNDGSPDPTTTELNNDRESLRRFDYAINEDNITAVVGVHNAVTPLPHLLSHSYNSIAVGRSDGSHSVGLTHFEDYGIGRSKPDIVAPQSTTSMATSSVSSVATLLHSSSTVLGTDAAQSETMKAILLAGARKDTLPSWSPIDGSGEWHPLDDTYGAGEVSVYNSYAITAGGQTSGTTGTPTTVPTHGWDFQTVQPGVGNELLYDFVIPTGKTADELSIALTWNAIVSAPFHINEPTLADLNLELVDSLGATIDTDLSDTYVDGLSESTIDNVEHIYLTNLAPGTYTLKVSSDSRSAEFGLAWRTATTFNLFTADFDEDGDTDGRDFLAWQAGFGKIFGATLADGDTDGDGDVDSVDLEFLQAKLFAANPTLAISLIGVPEPSAIALASGAAMLLLASRTRRHK